MLSATQNAAAYAGAAALLPEDRKPSELSLIEIAERLEQVTRLIEAERVREREARAAYKVVADEVEGNINSIRQQARALVEEQRRRMVSFDGMLASSNGSGPKTQQNVIRETKPTRSGRMSLADAILRIWGEGHQDSPLTTEEIGAALDEVGYSTKASARSLKSTMNQALAKLCREKKLKRYRIDGTEISASDARSRARRYMASR